jgi:cytoskeletal protein RodZ
MYEQAEPRAVVVRRILWLALWFVVIVVVVWGLIWLVFLRGDKRDVAKKNDTLTSHSQSNDKKDSKTEHSSGRQGVADDATGSSSTAGQQNTQAGTTATTNAATPSHLANAGAGDVILPVVVASVAGTVLYHVRLRYKYRLD